MRFNMAHGSRFAVTRQSVREAEEAREGQVLTCAGMQARAHRSTTRHERRVGVSPTPPLVHSIGNWLMQCAALVSFRQFGVQ